MSNPTALSIPKASAVFTDSYDGAFDPRGPQYSEREDSPLFGFGPWDRGDQLTLSFVDDGTKILNQNSRLFESFGWMLSADKLESHVLQAFQVWSRTTNLNVGLVEDGGDEVGSGGLRQHDTRFGDIRIGAIDMAPDVFAVAVPADELAAGTWAGEIIFNSAAVFSGPRHFYQVALHEAGHVLGLEHSTDLSSPMHPHGDSTRITKNDVTSLRELYGVRGLDVNEEEFETNDTMADATQFEYEDDHENGELPLVAFGDISWNDVDYFRVDVPSEYTGRLTVRLKTTGVSLLAPQVSVLDEAGTRLRWSESVSQSGDSITLSMPTTEKGGRYFIRVDGGDSNIFGVGTYVVAAIMKDVTTVGWQRVESLVASGLFSREEQSDFQEFLLDPEGFIHDDGSTDDDFFGAQVLTTPEGYIEQSRYMTQASLATATDLDYYRIKATQEGAGTLTNINIVMASLQRNGLIPEIKVFDSDFNPVRTAVLINSNGQYSVQARGVEKNRDYYIKIFANDASLAFTEGNYRMDVDFDDVGVVFKRFAAGTLNATNRVQEHTLHVAESQILHINALSQRSLAEPDAIIWVTVYDELGNVKFRSDTRPGETRSANSVLFRPGSYAIKIELALPDGSTSNADITYLVRGREISDSQGPKLLDPSDSPFPQCKPGSPDYCYPDNNDSPQPYIFVNGGYVEVDSPVTPWVDINKWYWYSDWLTPEVPPNL